MRRPVLAMLAAAASAAFATYYLDPKLSRRRRSVAAVDARNRARGTVAELRRKLSGRNGHGQTLDIAQETWAPATRFSEVHVQCPAGVPPIARPSVEEIRCGKQA